MWWVRMVLGEVAICVDPHGRAGHFRFSELGFATERHAPKLPRRPFARPAVDTGRKNPSVIYFRPSTVSGMPAPSDTAPVVPISPGMLPWMVMP